MDSRGYTSYRGRGSGGRPLLALLLLCVILASVGFVLAREQMVYDAEGNLRFRFPWDQEEPAPSRPDPSPEVEIQPPAVPPEEPAPPRRGRLLAAKPLTLAALAEASASLGEEEFPAVTLKDSAGRVYFESAAALPEAVRTEADTMQALERLTETAAVGRISCFLDSRAATADLEGRGLKNTGGYIFYDGANRQWLDPGKEGARRYLLDLIGEAAALGFAEILLTDVSYPTEGKLHKIDFSHAHDQTDEGRQETIAAFLREVRAVLPEGVRLSLELEAETIRAGSDGDAGQSLAQIAALVDCVYAPAAPDETEALSAAVASAAEGCRFIPEVTEIPAGETADWMLLEAA